MPIPLPIIKFLIRTGIAQRIPAVRALVPDPSYLRFYSDRILMAPNEPVAAMNTYLGRALPGAVDLSLGAPSEAGLRPPLAPATELHAADGYPPAAGIVELRQAVAAKLAQNNRIEVAAADEVAIVNGVSQAIHIVFDTFVNPGDKIVLLDPTFLVYAWAAQYHRARVAWVPSRVEQGWTRPDAHRLERAMRRARVVVVNSPSNPTGGVLEGATLERVLGLAKRHDVLVVSDEVYERFVYQGTHASIAALPGGRERTITLNSFSKSHAMAGCRVGYIAANRYLMRPMMAHQFIATPFVSHASQRMALAALAAPPDPARLVVAEYEARRGWLHAELGRMGLESALPGGAFYAWVPVRRFGMTGLEFATRLLDAENVLIMPGDFFGPSGAGHIRISYAAPRERLEEGAGRLARFVASLGGPAPAAARRHGAHPRRERVRRRAAPPCGRLSLPQIRQAMAYLPPSHERPFR